MEQSGNGIRRVGNKRTSGDHPIYWIIYIGQNTEKSPGDMRRLAVTQILGVKNCERTKLIKLISCKKFDHKKPMVYAQTTIYPLKEALNFMGFWNKNWGGSPQSRMVKEIYFGLDKRDFEVQSRYYVTLRLNTFKKLMKHLTPSQLLNCITAVLLQG